MNVGSSIARTALDAFQAKLSACHIYRPEEAHTECLQRMADALGVTTIKRQTPLVHLGYAMRVDWIHGQIQAFRDAHHSSSEAPAVQVVILGAGLDPIPNAIHVDVPEIMALKRAALEGIVPQLPGVELVEADLSDRSQVLECLLSRLDPEQPTLLVSELVLAYVEQRGALLSTLSSYLDQALLVLVEPMGPMEEGPLGAYQSWYLDRFAAKLERGGLTNTTVDLSLGATPDRIEDWLRDCGWTTAHATSLLEGAPVTRQAREPWDEHTALRLYLESYVVACAWNFEEVDPLVRWAQASWVWGVPTVPHDGFWCTPIQVCDEQSVRDVFLASYKHLFEEYPAVHRLCKTTLKKDLASDDRSTESAIACRYREWKGVFVVAVGENREVLGLVGVKPAFGKRDTMELVRLAVRSDQRRRNIASALLQSTIAFCQRRFPIGFSLEATTPEILDAANSFYSGHGFDKESSVLEGTMVMNTYRRCFPRSLR